MSEENKDNRPSEKPQGGKASNEGLGSDYINKGHRIGEAKGDLGNLQKAAEIHPINRTDNDKPKK